MQTWLRYTKLYGHFFIAQLKVMMEYRVDFLIGVLSVVLIQFTSVFFVKVVFDQIQALNGWNFYEVLFIYGIASTGRSIHHIFFDSLWTVGWMYVRTGNFDRILVRPINPLFHVIANRVQQDGFGQLAIGLILLCTAISHLDLAWTAGRVLLLMVMILSSGAIFVAVNLFFATLSFWMTDSLPIVYGVFQVAEFARYPLSIFSREIRGLLTWVIPYGFTAFYPASYFIEHSGYQQVALLTPLVAFVSCLIAYWFWGRGMRAYGSTGS